MSNVFQHTCGYCGNRFPERRTLVKHERCHTGEKPYACDSCDFRCSSSSSLCQHKRRRHDPTESGRKHICEQCGKGFYTRDNLKVDTLEMISIDGFLLILVYLISNHAHYYFLTYYRNTLQLTQTRRCFHVISVAKDWKTTHVTDGIWFVFMD